MIRSLYQLEDRSSHLRAAREDEEAGAGGQCGCEGSARWGVRGLLFDASEDRGQNG